MGCELGLCWNGTISFGDIMGGLISVAGILAAVATFVVQLKKSDHQAREQSKSAVELQKIEIYQRLEMASGEVFQYEAKHRDSLEKFRDIYPLESKISQQQQLILENFRLLEAGADPEKIVGPGATEVYSELERDVRALRKYYELTMNLFEVSARFRRDGIFEEAVFGSWTIWFYETCREWGFRWWWPDLRKNYMAQVRQIFDVPVETFQFEPSPTFETRLRALDRDDAKLLIEAEEQRQDELEARFFKHVAQIYECGVVAAWRENLDCDRAEIVASVADRRPFGARKQTYTKWSSLESPPPALSEIAKYSIPSPFLSDAERSRQRWP